MIFLTEIHQTFCRFCFQMEDINRRVYGIRHIHCRTQVWIVASFSLIFQCLLSKQTIVDWFRYRHLLTEKFRIPLLRLAASLIGKILLKLLDIRSHILRIRNILKHCIAVKLNDILHKTDQRLCIHDHMISQKIQTIITIRSLDHHDTIHR